MADIHTILKDPRYPEFLAAMKAKGRITNMDCFPWKYIGLSDKEFVALPLQTESGELASPELKRDWLPCIRAAEKDLCALWDWWLGWEWLAKDEAPPGPASRAAAVAELNPCRPGVQGTLF